MFLMLSYCLKKKMCILKSRMCLHGLRQLLPKGQGSFLGLMECMMHPLVV